MNVTDENYIRLDAFYNLDDLVYLPVGSKFAKPYGKVSLDKIFNT